MTTKEQTFANRFRTPEHQSKLTRNLKAGAFEGFGVLDQNFNANLDEAFEGDVCPKYLLNREKPWHRTVINMAAAGYTNVEIGKIVGRDVGTIANTLRQPWARRYLINEAKKTVQDEIKALLESEALPSIRKLVAVRDGEGVRPSDVIQASNSILDRFLGKPTQPITTDAKPMSELSDIELKEQIQRELTATQPN